MSRILILYSSSILGEQTFQKINQQRVLYPQGDFLLSVQSQKFYLIEKNAMK